MYNNVNKKNFYKINNYKKISFNKFNNKKIFIVKKFLQTKTIDTKIYIQLIFKRKISIVTTINNYKYNKKNKIYF